MVRITQDRNKQQDDVKTAGNLRVSTKFREFLEQVRTYWLLRKDSAHFFLCVGHLFSFCTSSLQQAWRDRSVQRLATGWTVRGSNLGAAETFRTRPDWSWDPPSLLYNGYRVSFPVIMRPGRGVNHPPHLAPRLKKEQSYTSTAPLGLFQGELCFYLT